MPRRQRTRHHATQPEAARTNRPLLLRLPPEVIAHLRALAEERGTTVSAVVMAAVYSSPSSS